MWLTDFRNCASASISPAPTALTVITGANGEGKTNLLESIAWLATLESFRGAPSEAMVRQGAPEAVVRATAWRSERELLIEGSITNRGRSRVQVNRQPLRRARDLLGLLRVSVLSPADLALVQGAPAERRRYLDDLLVACHPRADALRAEVERILRQRGALLKQASALHHRAGGLPADITVTLDVWDEKLADAGTQLANARAALVARLQPGVQASYTALAGPGSAAVELSYLAAWRTEERAGAAEGSAGTAVEGSPDAEGRLAVALAAARAEDLRRGTSTVGPHRDDLGILLDGMPARTHASQGEQRSLALALRLGGHGVVGDEVGEEPVLLLDDVFSDLDPARSAALLAHLPPGQTVLALAGPLPAGASPEVWIDVRAGVVSAR